MKARTVIALGLCFLLISGAVAFKSLQLAKPTSHLSEKPKPNPIDTCRACIEFAIAELDELLNAILNEGIIGNCNKLCSNITNPYYNAACNLLCDAIGLDAFIRAINKSDLDPIYYCQLLDHLCAIDDCTAPECTVIYAHEVRPLVAPYGTKFNVETYFGIVNTAGAGMLRYVYYQNPKDSQQVDLLVERYAPKGNYTQFFPLSSSELGLTPGVWTVEIYFCEGECYSKHPHSRLLDKATAKFTITKK